MLAIAASAVIMQATAVANIARTTRSKKEKNKNKAISDHSSADDDETTEEGALSHEFTIVSCRL